MRLTVLVTHTRTLRQPLTTRNQPVCSFATSLPLTTLLLCITMATASIARSFAMDTKCMYRGGATHGATAKAAEMAYPTEDAAMATKMRRM